jgi:hypothetical protein
MSKYVYSYSVYNTTNGKTIARGFDDRTTASNLVTDAGADRYKVRQHRTLREVA